MSPHGKTSAFTRVAANNFLRPIASLWTGRQILLNIMYSSPMPTSAPDRDIARGLASNCTNVGWRTFFAHRNPAFATTNDSMYSQIAGLKSSNGAYCLRAICSALFHLHTSKARTVILRSKAS